MPRNIFQSLDFFLSLRLLVLWNRERVHYFWACLLEIHQALRFRHFLDFFSFRFLFSWGPKSLKLSGGTLHSAWMDNVRKSRNSKFDCSQVCTVKGRDLSGLWNPFSKIPTSLFIHMTYTYTYTSYIYTYIYVYRKPLIKKNEFWLFLSFLHQVLNDAF